MPMANAQAARRMHGTEVLNFMIGLGFLENGSGFTTKLPPLVESGKSGKIVPRSPKFFPIPPEFR